MDRVEHLGVKEAAEFEGVKYKTLLRRLERKRIILANDPEDGRRALMPVSALSPRAYRAFVKAQTLAALSGVNQSIVPASGSANTPQGLLPFALPTQKETALVDAVPPALSERYGAYIELWRGICGDNLNGTWKRYVGSVYGGFQIRTRGDFIRAQAKLHGIGQSTIHAKLKVRKEINRDPEIPPEHKEVEFWTRILPKNRPGRSGHDFFSDLENDWMGPKLKSFYLTQAKCSVTHAHRLLLAEIDAKQRAWGAGHLYQKPTLYQCRAVLKGVDSPTAILAREGEKAFNDKCGAYISRTPEGLHSNDLWVTDQKVVDVRKRDGGERLGRIWMVNFEDVASEKILGYAFGPVLSSDMVMLAAAMALERYGVPGAVHMDLGKEFNCTAFNGSFRKISGEAMFRDAVGLWERLNVKTVKAIGRNPQSKTIERFHANLADFDRRFPGYCGSNTAEKPERLAEEKAQHEAWKQGKAARSPLVRIQDYVAAYIRWVETEWNAEARGRGKMRRGMTPNEAFNVTRPAAGFRTLTASEVEYFTADHRFLKIARGGQINVSLYGQTVEYQDPQLFLHQGEDVEVIISRRTLSSVQVMLNCQSLCEAHLKPLYHWLPEDREELRAAMRCKAATNRAIKQGLKAQRLLADAENPVELLGAQASLPAKETKQLFGQAPQHPETGSLEWLSTHPRKIREPREPVTSEGTADAVLALLKETHDHTR